MKQLQVFKNSEFGELGVLEIGGKTYFPATACAKVLGYANPKKAIRDHCNDPGVTKRSLGVQTGVKADGTPAIQMVEQKLIDEGNLYRLITHSKLPTAEKFERWVFDEVLPSIRKHGSYQTENSQVQNAELIGTIVTEVFKQVLPSIGGMVSMLVKEEMNANAQQPVQEYTSLKRPVPVEQVQQCKIELFPQHIITEVDNLFTEMQTQQTLNFSMISRFCTINGYPVSSVAAKRYFKKRFAN